MASSDPIQTAFSSPELVENILLHINVITTLRCERVNKFFNSIIANSPAINRSLWRARAKRKPTDMFRKYTLNNRIKARSKRLGIDWLMQTEYKYDTGDGVIRTGQYTEIVFSSLGSLRNTNLGSAANMILAQPLYDMVQWRYGYFLDGNRNIWSNFELERLSTTMFLEGDYPTLGLLRDLALQKAEEDAMAGIKVQKKPVVRNDRPRGMAALARLGAECARIKEEFLRLNPLRPEDKAEIEYNRAHGLRVDGEVGGLLR